MTALVLELAVAPILDLELVGPDGSLVPLAAQQPQSVVAVVGPPGPPAHISVDAENQLEIGQDGGLFVSPPKLATSQW